MLATQIQAFMQLPGVSKANFCSEALRGVNRKSLDKLLASQSQTECNSLVVYGRAYVFFEKKRLLEQAPKTAERCRNEMNYPQGFAVRHVAPMPPPPPLSPSSRPTASHRRRCRDVVSIH
jgi:hypothetical protein